MRTVAMKKKTKKKENNMVNHLAGPEASRVKTYAFQEVASDHLVNTPFAD